MDVVDDARAEVDADGRHDRQSVLGDREVLQLMDVEADGHVRHERRERPEERRRRREDAHRERHRDEAVLERHAGRRVEQRVDAHGLDAGPRRAVGAGDMVLADDCGLILGPHAVQRPVGIRELGVAHHPERGPDRNRVGNRDRDLCRRPQLVAGELEVVRREVAPPIRCRQRQRRLGDRMEADVARVGEGVRRDGDHGAVRRLQRAAVRAEQRLVLLRGAHPHGHDELGAFHAPKRALSARGECPYGLRTAALASQEARR